MLGLVSQSLLNLFESNAVMQRDSQSMFMFGFKSRGFQPFFPGMGRLMTLEIDRAPLYASVRDIGVTAVFFLFGFATELFERRKKRLGFFDVIDFNGLPTGQPIADGDFTGCLNFRNSELC